MFIDCHTHAFSEKIAAKVVEQLIGYYHIQTDFGGELGDLLRVADQAGLDGLILLVAATKPEQVRPAHDWVLSVAELSAAELRDRFQITKLPKIYHFGTFHPDDPNWLQEVRRLKGAKIKGIKLHPEFQGIDLADPRLYEFFEEIEQDFILMTHVGDPRVCKNNLSTPTKIAAIAKAFPQLRIIAAHMGGYCFWQESLEVLCGSNVYFDTSSTLSYIDDALLRRMVSKHGVEHILFGSDYPLNSPQRELELLERISWLSATAKSKILGENCQRLLDSVY